MYIIATARWWLWWHGDDDDEYMSLTTLWWCSMWYTLLFCFVFSPYICHLSILFRQTLKEGLSCVLLFVFTQASQFNNLVGLMRFFFSLIDENCKLMVMELRDPIITTTPASPPPPSPPLHRIRNWKSEYILNSIWFEMLYESFDIRCDFDFGMPQSKQTNVWMWQLMIYVDSFSALSHQCMAWQGTHLHKHWWDRDWVDSWEVPRFLIKME